MARLVVLNGPPAAGKSTVAARWVAAHPLALDLEIDGLRRMLGGWKDDPLGAGLLARELAVAAAGTHLRAGHDVLIPQYLGRTDFLARLERTADEAGAEFFEFMLMDTKDVMAARFHARTAAAADPAHVDAHDLLERVGGARQLEAMYDRLLLVLAARPKARLVPAREGAFDETYAAIASVLEA